MKLLKPFNLIMFVLIPIIMFFGFSLYSYADGSGTMGGTFQIKHSSTSYSDPNGYKCTVNLSGNPNFTINRDSNGSYTNDFIYATLKVTTSCGTFDIKSSVTNIPSGSSSSSSNLGFNDLGSITLPGYFINCYIDYFSGHDNNGSFTGTFYGEITDGSYVDTVNGTEGGSIVTSYSRAYPTAIGNSSYGNFSNIVVPILDSDSNLVTFEYGGSNEITAYDPNTCYYIAQNSIVFSVSNPDSNWGYDAYIFTLDGSNFCVKSQTFNSSTTSVNTTFVGGYYSSRPLKMIIRLWGVDSISDVTFTYQNWTYYSAPTSIKADWNTIGSSDELSDLGDTSTAIEDTLTDNNTFEESAFTSLDDSLDDFGFDTWSLVPGENGLKAASYFINSFYNNLPYKVQWLITSVIAFGLISMLLTVGTRVIQRTGEFTRARPVKFSNARGSKHG